MYERHPPALDHIILSIKTWQLFCVLQSTVFRLNCPSEVTCKSNLSSSDPLFISKAKMEFMARVPYILIVDDDTEDSEMLAGRFRRKHDQIPVQCLPGSQEAFSFLESRDEYDLPVILVTDFQMPNLNGVEFLKLLQLDHRYDNLAKVVLSNSGDPGLVDECRRYGATECLVKPNELGQLEDIVENLSELFLDRLMSTAGLIE
jgi:CheY-like chemotaxis protein